MKCSEYHYRFKLNQASANSSLDPFQSQWYTASKEPILDMGTVMATAVASLIRL
jgi:hypothetical protein